MNILTKSRKTILAVGVIAAIILISIGTYIYLNVPKNMIALDINPSIELHTNSFGQVVSIDPINQDAKILMAGYQLKDKDLENVIGDIVNRLFLNGYLTSENTNEILLSAEDTNSSYKLLYKVNSVIADYLNEKQLDVEVLQQKLDIDNEDIEVAHKNNVSVGKMAVINRLLSASDDVTVEELSDASIKELIQYYHDRNISIGDIMKQKSMAFSNSPTPSVTVAAGEALAAETKENLDVVSGAGINTSSENTSGTVTNSNENNDKKIKVKQDNNIVDDAKKLDAVSSASIKKTSESKKNTSKASITVRIPDMDTEEDNQDEDSREIAEKENYDDDDDDDDNDNDDDKYNNSDYKGSSMKEDNDAQDNEDSESEEDSDYDFEDSDNYYGNSDKEDNEGDNEDGNYQGDDDEDDNNQGDDDEGDED